MSPIKVKAAVRSSFRLSGESNAGLFFRSKPKTLKEENINSEPMWSMACVFSVMVVTWAGVKEPPIISKAPRDKEPKEITTSWTENSVHFL